MAYKDLGKYEIQVNFRWVHNKHRVFSANIQSCEALRHVVKISLKGSLQKTAIYPYDYCSIKWYG